MWSYLKIVLYVENLYVWDLSSNKNSGNLMLKPFSVFIS